MDARSALRIFRVSLVAAAAFAALSAQAGLVTWTIAGPGTNQVTQSGNLATASYDLPGTAGFSTNTWMVRALANSAGSYTFDWDFSGFHSFFGVTAFLTATTGDVLVSAGPASCCTAPSSGFAYSGTYTFDGLNAGDSFGFNLGGRHYDTAQMLNGSLKLTQQVPEPATFALMGIALLGVAAARRKS